jgi:tetratricopeptide (TPR) repeat protein
LHGNSGFSTGGIRGTMVPNSKDQMDPGWKSLMATKAKQRTKHHAAGLIQHAQRLLEKGDFKQALKDAKVVYRQQPGPEARPLLERAYLGRARQLCRAGLRVEARAVLESLLELGATDASVQQELPSLLIAVGLFDRISARSRDSEPLEEGSQLYSVAADHAVLRPEGAPASLPAIRQGAENIRRALAALETGHEAEALVLLKDVPRSSPFADWKYFVRGLAAYYREDSAEMQANWDRLDAGRFAARIAHPLRTLADPASLPSDALPGANALSSLCSEVFGGPMLAQLQTLQSHIAGGHWSAAVRVLRAVYSPLRQIDVALSQRVAMVLYAAMIHHGGPSALREMRAVGEPPPMDPHWNRGLAMAWEKSEDDSARAGEVSQAEYHWRAYLDELDHLECLLPPERVLARSLVWLRLGRMLTENSCPICTTCHIRHEPDEELRRRAIECFENSLRLSPDLLDTYRELAQAYQEWDEPQRAAATRRRLIERFPEDLDTLLALTDYHVRRDEPFAASEYVLRARRLRPLDANIRATVWSVHLASARHHALAGRFDDGRAELTAAEKIGESTAEQPHLLVRRAALESKAGDFALANRLLDRASNELGETAPVWLLMAIESRRYALPRTVADEFEHRWRMSLKKARRSAAIGVMCQMATAHLAMKVEYQGRDDHMSTLVEFLRGCKRIRWQDRHLRDVIEFLLVVENEEERQAEQSSSKLAPSDVSELLADLSAKARRKFPDNAFFQFLGGEMEMRKGPWKCNRRIAGECFGRVLQLTEGSNDAEDLVTVRRARERLDLLAQPAETFVNEEDDDDDVDDLEDGPFGDFDPGIGDESRGLPDFSPTDMPEKLFQKFARVCRSMGLDPLDVLDKAAADMPFRFKKDGSGAKRGK